MLPGTCDLSMCAHCTHVLQHARTIRVVPGASKTSSIVGEWQLPFAWNFLRSSPLRLCHSVIASATSNVLSTVTLTSLTLQHLYTWAGARCYSHTGAGGDGLQACQVCRKTKRRDWQHFILFWFGFQTREVFPKRVNKPIIPCLSLGVIFMV